MATALIITYHAVETGPAPLCLDPALFETHADVIADMGIRSVTVRDLADSLTGTPEENVVAITFDDGFASAAEVAAPLLLERGLTATLFCVAGHLGGASDWQTARRGSYESRLADAARLTELAAAGFEIGSHGMAHAPLADAPEPVLLQEIVDSRRALESELGAQVTSYAYAYGALPGAAGRKLVEETYEAACTTSLGRVTAGFEPYALPRIDVHYLRNPEFLRRALDGRLRGYLRARGLAARARKTVVKDYSTHSPATV
jgi:peptidoglycan/xylan/chitin deacetylase (PgdA/CDA1 family)